jgi:hypothetical protein
MRQAVATGVSFGLTSGVITTLGLMVGLHAGTHSSRMVAGEHLLIAAVVVVVTHLLGDWVAAVFRTD